MGTRRQQTERRATGKATADPLPGLGASDETGEVTITLSGQTLIKASVAAAQLCVPLAELTAVYARDVRRYLDDLHDGSDGYLLDLSGCLHYPDPETAQQARRNIAIVARAHRVNWIAETAAAMEIEWEAADGRRLLKDTGGGRWIHTPHPAALKPVLPEDALKFMTE